MIDLWHYLPCLVRWQLSLQYPYLFPSGQWVTQNQIFKRYKQLSSDPCHISRFLYLSSWTWELSSVQSLSHVRLSATPWTLGNLTLKASGIWLQNFHRTGETDSWRAQTKPSAHQDPGERSSDPQTCLWVSRRLWQRDVLTGACCGVRGIEYNSPGISPFEGLPLLLP